LPWIGVEAEKVEKKKFEETVLRYGLTVFGEIEVEIKTSRGWLKFIVLEVGGFVERLARDLSKLFDAAAIEAGPHLILGEPSAKIWDEAVKVVFPDGEEEVIPVFTNDSFLDVRIPNERIKGVRGSIVVGGKKYELPLTPESLIEIYTKGEEFFKKVEKAASVYGISSIVSAEALKALREKTKAPPRYEIDYDAGLALIYEKNRIKTVNIIAFLLDLLLKGFEQEALKIFEKAPEELKNRIRDAVKEEYEVYRDIGDLGALRLRSFAEHIGLEIIEEKEKIEE